VIWNSDQGSHITSLQYTQWLLAAGVQISMDGKGRASDNVFTGRLWRTLKYEDVCLNDYANPKAARRALTGAISTSMTTRGAVRRWTITRRPVSTPICRRAS